MSQVKATLQTLSGLLGPQLMQQFLADNMVLGQFQPNQNILETLADRQFNEMVMQTSQGIGGSIAADDISNIIMGRDGTGQGGLVGMGLMEPGAVQSQDVAGAIGSFAPYINMAAPWALDALGPGFSAMGASQQIGANLRPHMAAPGSPGSGLSAQQVKQRMVDLTGAAFDQLYEGGAVARGPATSGYGFNQLTAMGMAANSMGYGPAGGLQGTGPGQFANYLSDVGSLASSVRDIGPQFAGLDPTSTFQMAEKLTAGGMATMSMPEAGMGIRQFSALQRRSGMDITQASSVTGAAARRMHELGADPATGAFQMGISGLAYGLGVKELGHEAMESSGLTPSKSAKLDASLRAQASQSNNANKAAAIVRLGEAGLLEEGSEGHRLYERILAGDPFIGMPISELRSIMHRSGVDEDAFNEIIHQRNYNIEVHGPEVADAVRGGQWESDIKGVMSSKIANALSRQKKFKKMKPGQLNKLGAEATEIYREVSGSGGSLEEARQEFMNRMGVSGDVATAMIGEVGEAAALYGTRTQQLGMLHSDRIFKDAGMHKARAREIAEAEAEAASPGQMNPFERLVESVKSGVPDMLVHVFRFLGGIDNPIDDGPTDAEVVAGSSTN